MLYAARETPAGLALTLPDLRSRLAQCTQLPLALLDEAGRREVLRRRAEARGLSLDEAVLDYLFRRVGRDLSTLTCCLNVSIAHRSRHSVASRCRFCAACSKMVGSDENTAIEFWKKRLEMTAAVPSEIARVGALTPQMRELTRIDNLEERKRLTKARLIAFTKLAPEQRQLIAAARRKAFEVDKGVMDADQKLVDELLRASTPRCASAYPQA